MSPEQLVEIENRLTKVEERCKSNTHRIDEHDESIKENSCLITSIRELAMETKYMREDLNQTMARLSKLENSGSGKWEKFKWIVLTAVVSVLVGFLAAALGLK